MDTNNKPQPSIHWQEAVAKSRQLIEAKAVKRLLVCRGRKSFEACGGDHLLADITDGLGCEVTPFCDFTPNPKHEEAVRGAGVMRESGCDGLMAIGGGSVMDMAKLIRLESGREDLPLIAIPTTAGTGAEITPFAVCYKDGAKQSVGSPKMRPNLALLVPELVCTGSPYLTACAAIDAMAQCFEALLNVNATDQSDRFARQGLDSGFHTVMHLISRDYFKGNGGQLAPDEAYDLQQMATLSGEAISLTRTTLPHALSYTLTTHYGYPHGHAVALTLPYFMQHYATCSAEEVQTANPGQFRQRALKVQQRLGIPPFASMMQEWWNGLLQGMGLAYDSQRDFDDERIVRGVNMERAKNSPVRVTEALLREAVASIRSTNT